MQQDSRAPAHRDQKPRTSSPRIPFGSRVCLLPVPHCSSLSEKIPAFLRYSYLERCVSRVGEPVALTGSQGPKGPPRSAPLPSPSSCTPAPHPPHEPPASSGSGCHGGEPGAFSPQRCPPHLPLRSWGLCEGVSQCSSLGQVGAHGRGPPNFIPSPVINEAHSPPPRAMGRKWRGLQGV